MQKDFKAKTEKAGTSYQEFSDLSQKNKKLYMENLKSLYGDKINANSKGAGELKNENGCLPSAKEFKPVQGLKSAVRKMERKMQMEVSGWLKNRNIKHHHSPNEGRRSKIAGYLLKLMGMSAGFPDFFIPYPSQNHHALFIELKLPQGKLSATQSEWLTFLNEQGYLAVTARSKEEAIDIIAKYMNMVPEYPTAA